MFERQSAAIACQSAILADDAVAWNDQGDRIFVVGTPNGLGRLDVARGGGNPLIRPGLAEGNVAQPLPYLQLKFTAGASDPV